MALLIQHALVTIVALGALGVIVRRVVGTVRPAPGASPCSTCAAGTAAQAHRPQASGIESLAVPAATRRPKP